MDRCFKIATFMLLAGMLAGKVQAQPSVPAGAILTAPGLAGDGRWHWIQVEPARGNESGWVTVTGDATVTIAKSRFHAELKVDPGQTGADITLVGKISNGRVRGSQILLNTDARPAPVSGIIRFERIGDSVEERIAFTGGQSGAASFLGLYRRVRH